MTLIINEKLNGAEENKMKGGKSAEEKIWERENN